MDISGEINKIIVTFTNMNFMIYTKLQIIVRIVKRRTVRWAGHVGRTGETSIV